MKKVSLLLASAMLLVSVSAFAACDPAAATADFQKAVQEATAKDPAKVAAIQEDLAKLQADIPALAEAGKTDEICAALEAVTAKLK